MSEDRASTGIDGLERILCDGFIGNHAHLSPGTAGTAQFTSGEFAHLVRCVGRELSSIDNTTESP